MLKRRAFLKLTALLAAGHALHPVRLAAQPLAPSNGTVAPDHSGAVLPAAWWPRVQQSGLYRVSGIVRLNAPVVEIGGITHRQQISWSGRDGVDAPLASFTSFERYDVAGAVPSIRVQGGQLESLTAVLVD